MTDRPNERTRNSLSPPTLTHHPPRDPRARRPAGLPTPLSLSPPPRDPADLHRHHGPSPTHLDLVVSRGCLNERVRRRRNEYGEYSERADRGGATAPGELVRHTRRRSPAAHAPPSDRRRAAPPPAARGHVVVRRRRIYVRSSSIPGSLPPRNERAPRRAASRAAGRAPSSHLIAARARPRAYVHRPAERREQLPLPVGGDARGARRWSGGRGSGRLGRPTARARVRRAVSAGGGAGRSSGGRGGRGRRHVRVCAVPRHAVLWRRRRGFRRAPAGHEHRVSAKRTFPCPTHRKELLQRGPPRPVVRDVVQGVQHEGRVGLRPQPDRLAQRPRWTGSTR